MDKFNPDSEYIKKYGMRFCKEKYLYLIHAPFKISCYCCNIMKKKPFEKYFYQTGMYPIIGTMTSESKLRENEYLRSGCNSFDNSKPISAPIAFWTEKDIWEYIKTYNISYSSIYDMGYKRTGCMFCMFGITQDRFPNRFQLMENTHPKIYDYCMNDLGIGRVLDYINVPYRMNQNLPLFDYET